METPMLAQRGVSPYRIIVPRQASDPERYAARELMLFLSQMTGAVLPIFEDDTPPALQEIVLGPCGDRLREAGLHEMTAGMGAEEFMLKTVGRRLFIAGGRPRGVLYGVYALLEDRFGCRWFSSKVSHIPHYDALTLPLLDERQRPAFFYREPYMRDAFDGSWCARNRVNSNKSNLTPRQGGKFSFYNFHHSFEQLIAVSEYFDDHPEYFSQIDGKRMGGRTQLCLTNPDVLALCIDRVRQWIRDNPGCDVFSVAQNDWHNYCTCPACRAVDEREGSHSGTMIAFVNAIAEAVEEDHPGVYIHTFAYQYTRRAPRHIRPRHNVIVRLCSIECCFSHPLEQCTWQRGRGEGEENLFVRDIREWSAICENLFIWDYITNFSNYVMPFPNLRVLEANLKFFRRYGVKGVLEQGNFSFGGGGEMNELRSWVLAKLLWNPDYGAERAIGEFLTGYFGGGADAIGRYLELLHDGAAAHHVCINDPFDAPYLNPLFLDRAEALFDEAEEKAGGDEEVLTRIRIARLPITYIRLCRLPMDAPGREARIDAFARDLEGYGITEIWERRHLDESIARLKQNAGRDRSGMMRWSYYM